MPYLNSTLCDLKYPIGISYTINSIITNSTLLHHGLAAESYPQQEESYPQQEIPFYKLYRINSSQILNVNAKNGNIWKILGRLGLSEFGKSALDSDNSRTTGAGISQRRPKQGYF